MQKLHPESLFSEDAEETRSNQNFRQYIKDVIPMDSRRFYIIIMACLALMVICAASQAVQITALKEDAQEAHKAIATQDVVQHPEPVQMTVPEPVEPPAPTFTPMDIPLPIDLQQHTWELCQEYDVPFEVVLAVMYQETGYRDLTVMDSNGLYSTGFMMVNAIAWPELEEMEIDVHSEEGGIEAGIIILADYWHRYPPEQALTAYNCGESRMLRNGLTSTRYSRKIMEEVNAS